MFVSSEGQDAESTTLRSMRGRRRLSPENQDLNPETSRSRDRCLNHSVTPPYQGGHFLPPGVNTKETVQVDGCSDSRHAVSPNSCVVSPSPVPPGWSTVGPLDPLYKTSRAGADRGPKRDTRYRPRRGRWRPLLTMWSLNSRSVLSVCLCVWTVSVCIVHVIRAECPHEPSGKTLRRWSDASSWPSGEVSERALLMLLLAE